MTTPPRFHRNPHAPLGRYTTKQPLVVAGLSVAERLLEIVDPSLQYRPLVEDGDSVTEGTAIAEVRGSALPS